MPPSPPKPKAKRLSAWNLLLFLPAVGLAFPGLYSRETPELAGVPFIFSGTR